MCSVDTASPCPIYLTISPLTRHVNDSFLEINWGPHCSNPPEKIDLYAEDPSASYSAPYFSVQINGQSTGHVKTNMKVGKFNLPYGWNFDEALISAFPPKRISTACLPFYIASFNGKQLQTSNCLKIQPNWMSLMRSMHNISLENLFLPGTHCSACYDHGIHSRSILRKKFGYVQNFNVWTQLVFGVRYLDISVG